MNVHPDADERYAELTWQFRGWAAEELRIRHSAWPIDGSRIEVHEVVEGLMARQATLASDLIESGCTRDAAPLVLRAMVEVHISVSWILRDPVRRSRQFVLYGLGQVKLEMEHLKAKIQADGGDPESDPLVRTRQAWIDAQRFHFLTDVSVGSWSDRSIRDMAMDCKLDGPYADYVRWSAATHSMWHHIEPCNLRACSNPLHRGGHKIGAVPRPSGHVVFALWAMDYLEATLRAFDEFLGKPQTGASAKTRFMAVLTDIEGREKARAATEQPDAGAEKS